MTITSVAELEQARAALVGRPAAELADFILSLAFAADGISEYVRVFVLAEDGKAAAELLSSELEFLRDGERDRDYRYRKGAGHVEQISEHCWDDDFGSSQLSDRAWTMVEKLAATLPAEDVGPAIERLRGGFAARAAGSGR